MTGLGDIAALLALREAVASVAASHEDTCACAICKAAHGDQEAFAVLLAAQLDAER